MSRLGHALAVGGRFALKHCYGLRPSTRSTPFNPLLLRGLASHPGYWPTPIPVIEPVQCIEPHKLLILPSQGEHMPATPGDGVLLAQMVIGI